MARCYSEESREVKTGLKALNDFLKDQNLQGQLTYRTEVSHLVRAGRSQISLNVSEEGNQLDVVLYKGKKKIKGECAGNLATDAARFKAFILSLKSRIELMPEIPHLTAMKPVASNDHVNTRFDSSLIELESQKLVDFFQQVKDRFDESEVEVSGAFSAGGHGYGVINTLVEEAVFYQGSDWNLEVVLQLVNDDKKEVRTGAVGETWQEFDADALIESLNVLYELKRATPRIDLEPGEYDVVFSADAFAEMTSFVDWLALSGETFEYQSGMLQKDQHKPGDKVFGSNITITDDPKDPDVIFARPVGLNGFQRERFPLVNAGVLKQMYYSDKDTCDRFGKDVNNDSSVASLKVHAGNGPESFADMVKSTQRKTLYIGFIHYMNSTNPARGEFTGTSRFGTLLMENGEVKSHLYNLRINDSFHRIFNQVEWLSGRLESVNMSNTYFKRQSSSIACPAFVKVSAVKITGTAATDG